MEINAIVRSVILILVIFNVNNVLCIVLNATVINISALNASEIEL